MRLILLATAAFLVGCIPPKHEARFDLGTQCEDHYAPRDVVLFGGEKALVLDPPGVFGMKDDKCGWIFIQTEKWGILQVETEKVKPLQ